MYPRTVFIPSNSFNGLCEQIKSSFTTEGENSNDVILLCKIIKLPPTSFGPPFRENISFYEP